MSRLDSALAALRDRGEGAFMPFLVIGDPSVGDTERLADALVESGCDALEFGLAFSDPPADGPVIQAADVRALAGGVNVDDALACIGRVSARHPSVPLTMLVYYNLVLQRGVERFYLDVAAAGVDAVLVADLPLESAEQATHAARDSGVAPIFVVSELTTDARLRRVAEVAEGYLYVVGKPGVTGERSELASTLGHTIARVRAASALPLLVGFGISEPAQVREVLDAGADGAICGSAIVRRIAASLDDMDAAVVAVGSFSQAMKGATLRRE
jgi:tryptophan synthase alpha chain